MPKKRWPWRAIRLTSSGVRDLGSGTSSVTSITLKSFHLCSLPQRWVELSWLHSQMARPQSFPAPSLLALNCSAHVRMIIKSSELEFIIWSGRELCLQCINSPLTFHDLIVLRYASSRHSDFSMLLPSWDFLEPTQNNFPRWHYVTKKSNPLSLNAPHRK